MRGVYASGLFLWWTLLALGVAIASLSKILTAWRRLRSSLSDFAGLTAIRGNEWVAGIAHRSAPPSRARREAPHPHGKRPRLALCVPAFRGPPARCRCGGTLSQR